jgi:tripartite-type tricarboxylate transporter receptor subunit TctC
VSVSLALPPFRAGKINILGIGSPQRLPPVADMATVDESGLPGYRAATWFGLFATGGTPRDVVMKINTETARIFAEPAFREKFLAPQMFEPLVTSPEEFVAFIKSEQAKWSKVIREAGLKIE